MLLIKGSLSHKKWLGRLAVLLAYDQEHIASHGGLTPGQSNRRSHTRCPGDLGAAVSATKVVENERRDRTRLGRGAHARDVNHVRDEGPLALHRIVPHPDCGTHHLFSDLKAARIRSVDHGQKVSF